MKLVRLNLVILSLIQFQSVAFADKALLCVPIPGQPQVSFTGKVTINGPYYAEQRGFLRGDVKGVVQIQSPSGANDTVAVSGNYVEADSGYEAEFYLFGLGKSGARFFVSTAGSNKARPDDPATAKIQVNTPLGSAFSCKFHFTEAPSTFGSIQQRCHGSPGNCF